MSKRLRLNKNERRNLIFEAAIVAANNVGLYVFTLNNVSEQLPNTSLSTVKHYYKIDQLRDDIINYSIENGVNKNLLAQAIIMNNHLTKKISDKDKQEYLSYV